MIRHYLVPARLRFLILLSPLLLSQGLPALAGSRVFEFGRHSERQTGGGQRERGAGGALVQSAMTACAAQLGITLPTPGAGSSDPAASLVTPSQWHALGQCVKAQVTADKPCETPVQQARKTLDQCRQPWGQAAASSGQALPTDGCATQLAAFTQAVQTAQVCLQQVPAPGAAAANVSAAQVIPSLTAPN